MRDKFIQMRPLLKDKNVISDCETQIKEYQKYIDYFTEELHRLTLRQEEGPPENNENAPQGTLALPQDHPPRTSSITANVTSLIQSVSNKKKYSNLDLLMSETPYNKPKVSLKLHELEYKLDVEKTVLKGIKGMAEVLERHPSGDRKNRTDVQDKMSESMEKLSLLNSALRKYKSLYIGEGGDEDDYELETPPSARLPPGFRRPVTGKLQLEILEACELAHAPTRLIRTPSTVVFVKIDNQIVFRSRPSKNDKWNELCETHVNKASEIEISIYDQSTEKSLPIGILWLKITDITEGLRKRKRPQWVLAEQRQLAQGVDNDNSIPPQPSVVNQAEGGIEAWFDVEPVGRVALRLNFVRAEGNRRPMDKLGRAGAVRQRREEVVEVNGHQFVENRFYNVMKCALCQEFFVNSGYQCEDCEYTCHKKCSSKVVTKCVSNSTETVSDEDKLNHKIPHRFEPITNIGANWCCHCGYMLPLGSRGSKKCSECGITAHTRCERYVPDFCGLSMEMANQMLAEIKAAAKRKTLESKSSSNRISKTEKTEEVVSSVEEDLVNQLSQVSVSPASPQSPPVPPPKSPVVVPQTPPTMYNNNVQQPHPQQSVHQQPAHQQSYPPYSPQQQPMSMPQPPRIYPPQQQPQQPPPQQQRPPMLPPHGQPPQSPYGYNPAQPNVDPRYQQYYPQQQPQQMRPQMPYSPYQQQPSPQQQQMMMRPPSQPMSPYQQQQQQQQQQIVSQGQHMQGPPKQPGMKRKVALENFSFLAVLGKGNFGKVMLAEDKYDKQLYAIKMLKKRFIIDNDEIESVRSEKRVFQAANRARHPFLINLHSTFQTESRVYFVMEYVNGGDLMWHIQRGQFSERRAKFYACEVLLALEYFHSQGIIYRDLKLDNIMLGLDGHIKMADYGLCKENMGYGNTTGTFCGTPEFMAPEILREQNYGRAVDWWAYGVLIYEMLLGQSPFRGEDEDEIFDAILEDDILYPINMSSDSISICQQLLQRDPNRRLGGGPDDAVPIKRHPFFRGVVWEDILNKRIPPPFYPSVSGRLDTSNFDEEFTNETPALTPIDATLNRVEQQEFQNFSYVADWVSA
ncbi:Putative AGC/PKC protein kinase [Rhizopus microsporus]|nr:Putative AGC/PKC protein kinase [Rhizopus microsporus]